MAVAVEKNEVVVAQESVSNGEKKRERGSERVANGVCIYRILGGTSSPKLHTNTESFPRLLV